MKKLLAITLFLFTLLHFTPSTAQSKTVTINGKVTSFEESLPLEGVSIQVKNSKNATVHSQTELLPSAFQQKKNYW